MTKELTIKAEEMRSGWVSTFRTEAFPKSLGRSFPVSNQMLFVSTGVAQPRLRRTAALVGLVRSVPL